MARIQNARPPIFLEPVWRLFNLGLFVAALLGPWGSLVGKMVTGAEALRFVVLSSLMPSTFSLSAIYYFLFVIGLLAYWAVNIILIFRKLPAHAEKWLLALIMMNAVLLLLDMAIHTFFSYIPFWRLEYYWGYWFLLLSFSSALALELKARIPVKWSATGA
jgi:hypothetical protein